MLYFEYEEAKVGEAVEFEVKNSSGEVVKSGSTTILRPADGVAAEGQRHISIVNTGVTILPSGEYTVRLLMEQRELKRLQFTIE